MGSGPAGQRRNPPAAPPMTMFCAVLRLSQSVYTAT